MRKILYLFFVIILSVSCEKVERIDEYPAHKSKLVVNCIFNPDNPFIFNLSKSLSPLDNAPFRDFTSPNGLVVVYEDNVFFDSIRYDDLKKSFHGKENKKPMVGKTYRFDAYYPGFEKVSASGSIPEKFEITEHTINERKIFIDYTYIIRANISLSSTVPSSSYLILTATAYDNAIITAWGDTIDPVFSPYLVETTLGTSSELIGNTLFIKMENSGLNKLNLESEIYTYYDESIVNQLNLKYEFTIFSCSKEVFEYKRRASLQNINQYDPFAEPTPIFNNIQNGFGIFGGENNSFYTIIK
jgi:hypothetical protein